MMMRSLPPQIGRLVSEKRLAAGERLPRGYGIAWALPYSFMYYCLPVPLNKIAGCFRSWFLQWQRPCEDDPLEGMCTYGRSIGYKEGRRAGYQAAIGHCRELIRASRRTSVSKTGSVQ